MPPVLQRVSPVIQTAIMSFGAVILFYTAGVNNVSVAEYMAFSVSFGMMSAAIVTLTNVALLLAEARPMLEMAKPILEAEPELVVGKKLLTSIHNIYKTYWIAV
jgi:ABC-type bacteriocin/lantibiotic exporter with double-glycine peptidase domain